MLRLEPKDGVNEPKIDAIASQGPKWKQLTAEQWQSILQALLLRSEDGPWNMDQEMKLLRTRKRLSRTDTVLNKNYR